MGKNNSLDYETRKDVEAYVKKLLEKDGLVKKSLSGMNITVADGGTFNYYQGSGSLLGKVGKGAVVLAVGGILVVAVVGSVSEGSLVPNSMESNAAYLSGQMKSFVTNDTYRVVSGDDLVCEPDRFMGEVVRVSSASEEYDNKIQIVGNCENDTKRVLDLLFDYDKIKSDKLLEDLKKYNSVTLYGELVDRDTFLVSGYEDARKTINDDVYHSKKGFRAFVEKSVRSYNLFMDKVTSTFNELNGRYDEIKNKTLGVVDKGIKTGNDIEEGLDKINNFVDTVDNVSSKNYTDILNDASKVVVDLVNESASEINTDEITKKYS